MRYIRGYFTLIQAEAYINGLADANVDCRGMIIKESKDRFTPTGYTYSIYNTLPENNESNKTECEGN